LESAVLVARVEMLLQWLDLVGQPMCSHTDSHQAFILQNADLVIQGSNLGELKWSRLFAPSSLKLGKSACKWTDARLMVLAIEPCPMPSLKRSFERKAEKPSMRVSLKTNTPDDLLVGGT
jgi:hypothetical protein